MRGCVHPGTVSDVPDVELTPDGVFLDIQSALAGRYSLMRELGRGGMAIVYLAHEVRLDRLVALKVLPAYLATPSLRERFLQEARTAAKLSHPNIVSIHAVDEVKDFVFFAMAYIDGETLAERIGRVGPLPPNDVAGILRDVAQALAYAHRQGVVHRDIKPANILIDRDNNRPMVADFGIAHVSAGASNTGVGQLIGTPEFMSPEQATGSALDGRSDIYSLGLVAFSALSGRLPFRGDSLGSILAQRIGTPAPRLQTIAPMVAPRLASVVDRCLATTREERYQTGEVLAEALDAAFDRPRRLPAALERWVQGVVRLPFALAMLAPLFAYELIGQMSFLADSFYAKNAPDLPSDTFDKWPWTGYAAYIGLPFAVYAAHRLFEVRKARREGFGLEDFRMALVSEIARHRDALTLSANRVRLAERLKDAAPGVLCVVLGLTAFGKCADQYVNNVPFASWLLWLVLTGLFVAVRLSRKAGRSVEAVDLETRAFFWERWPGAFSVWLAGLGLTRKTAMATHQPTEVALGGAAAALFDALPRALQQNFSTVPGVIERLEARAQAMRRLIDELMALETTHPSPSAEPLSLQRQRERAQQGLTDVVTALEKIRLGLLRLQGGTSATTSISADIADAEEVCRALDALSAGQAEVERLLRPHGAPPPAVQNA